MKVIRLLPIFLLIGLALPLFGLPKIAHVGMSAILPGSGQISLGKVNRGAVMLTADLLSISMMLQSSAEIRSLQQSYTDLAGVYAGVESAPDERFWQDMQNYRSSAEFNQRQEMLARNYYLLYLTPNDQYSYADYLQMYQDYLAANTYGADETWEWVDEVQWRKYRNTRGDYQETKLMKNLFVGLMIFNRVLSVIDVAFINPPGEAQRLYLTPSGETGLMLNYQMGF